MAINHTTKHSAACDRCGKPFSRLSENVFQSQRDLIIAIRKTNWINTPHPIKGFWVLCHQCRQLPMNERRTKIISIEPVTNQLGLF